MTAVGRNVHSVQNSADTVSSMDEMKAIVGLTVKVKAGQRKWDSKTNEA